VSRSCLNRLVLPSYETGVLLAGAASGQNVGSCSYVRNGSFSVVTRRRPIADVATAGSRRLTPPFSRRARLRAH